MKKIITNPHTDTNPDLVGRNTDGRSESLFDFVANAATEYAIFDLQYRATAQSQTWTQSASRLDQIVQTIIRDAPASFVSRPQELSGQHRSLNLLPILDAKSATIGYLCWIARANRIFDEPLVMRSIKSILEVVPLAVSVMSVDGRYIYANPATTISIGFPVDRLIGQQFGAYLGASPSDVGARAVIEAALAGTAGRYERQRFDAGLQQKRTFRVDAIPYRNRAGLIVAVMLLSVDIEQHKQTSIQALASSTRLAGLFAAGAVAAMECDQNLNVTWWSGAAQSFFGFSEAEVLNNPILNLTSDDEALKDRLRKKSQNMFALGEGAAGYARNRVRVKDERETWCDWYETVVTDPISGELRVLSLAVDVTQSVKLKESLAHASVTDRLTGLPNRLALDTRLEALSERTPATIFFIDLAGYKELNDLHGHSIGDALLQELGVRFNRLQGEVFIARFGGDEFVAILDGANDPAYCMSFAERLLNLIKAPSTINQIDYMVGGSIGIAQIPRDAPTGELAMRYADLAMYEAKRERSNIVRYGNAIGAAAHTKAKFRLALETAIKEGTILVAFQPRFNVLTDALVGAEALLRWTDPKLGVVSPAQFVAFAEANRLIDDLFQIAFEEACAMAVALNALKLDRVLTVSVNLSPVQLRDKAVLEQITKTLEKSGCSGAWIRLEITESQELSSQLACDLLKAVRDAHGIESEIDDFGTGYSNLAQLRSLPIRTLKLDRHFTQNMEADAGTFVSAIHGLGSALGLTTLAEGVETAAQLAVLRAQGWHEYQGFLRSPAVTREEFLQAVTTKVWA